MSGSALEGRTGRPYDDTGKDIGGVAVGTHAAYVFSDSAEKQQRLFSIVDHSLQDPTASVFYIAGKQGVKGIRFSMKDYGIDVGAIERQRKIKIADSQEFFLTATKTQTFKPIETVRGQLTELAESQTKAGYYYLTVISETDFLVRKGFFQQYREFELELGRKLQLSRGVFVCAYDMRELAAAGQPESVKSELERLHSTLLE